MMSSPQNVASASAAVTTLILTTPRIIDAMKTAYYNYGEKSMKRMIVIQTAYELNCFEIEKDTSVSTLINPTAAEKLPRYFLMSKTNPKIPQLYLDGFVPNISISRWEKNLNKNDLFPEIQDLISYICEYQVIRDRGLTAISVTDSIIKEVYKLKEMIERDSPFFYDPINMFCEEFKMWLSGISKINIDDKSKVFITARIKYLNDIYQNYANFSQPQSVEPFLPIVNHIKEILEIEIQQKIDSCLSRKSARECFYGLTVETKSVMRNTLQFLFYVFKDSTEIPENFIIRQVSNPTLKAYQSALNSIAGKLLQHLINESVYACSEPAITTRKYEINLVKLSYQFINENTGSPRFPLNIPNVHLYNWFSTEKQLSKEQQVSIPKLGILEEFREPELMQNFLFLHGYIEKLAVFINVYELLYEASGDIGNLYVYKYATTHVKFILNEFDTLRDTIQKNIQNLKQAADQFYDKCVRNVIKKTDKIENWINCYKNTNLAYNSILECFENYVHKKNQLLKLIATIEHPQYPETIQKRIFLLNTYVGLLYKDQAISKPTTQTIAVVDRLSQTATFEISNNNNEFGQNINYNEANELYEKGNYEEATEKYGNLVFEIISSLDPMTMQGIR